VIDTPQVDLLNSATVLDEVLPLLGETLPLEPITAGNVSVNVLPPENALFNNAMTNTVKKDVVSSYISNNKTDSKASDNTVIASQALEEQGFYVQSLVSSVIGNDVMTGRLDTRPHIDTEPAKAVHILPQQASFTLGSTAEALKSATSSQSLIGSELDEALDEADDKFLGSELELSLAKPRKSAVVDIFSASPNMAMSQPPSVIENTVSLALAMNEDPTSQSLDELIDSEAIEQGDAEAKLTALEKKQDDQTLKLSKGQQAWGDALTERITMNAAQDIKQVTIHLDPPELGSLELKMKVNDDQQAQIQVQVQSPQVREALESSAHRLRDMLAREGLELSEFNVQADTGHDNPASKDSDAQGHEQSQDSDASPDEGEEMSLEIAKPKNNNLLDTFV
jgi:flagellar hook-length control protein FliK